MCPSRPPDCCDVDSDCPAGFECAYSVLDRGKACQPRLADQRQCWSDEDCPGAFYCYGAAFCSCGKGPCADTFPGECQRNEDHAR